MLKGDNGRFLRELTDLIFRQLLTNAISFFNLEDTEEHRRFYEYVSDGLAAFIIRWTLGHAIAEDQAVALLANSLLQVPAGTPKLMTQ